MPDQSISDRGEASRTAMMTAVARGWHHYQHGRRSIHQDALGWPLVGPDADQLMSVMHGVFGDAGFLLANWIAARSRIAEDWLAASPAQQYVVLGAGLDSFAWRAPAGMQVFEVDHPASQRWKQDRLRSMMVDAPTDLVWVGVDFEQDSVSSGLRAAGLDADEPVFASWLGVTPYLSKEAVVATLSDLPATEVAISYAPPEAEWGAEARTVTEAFLPFATAIGEAIIGLYTKDEIEQMLRDAGFRLVEEVRAHEVEGRFGLKAIANVEERMVLARRES